MKTPFPYQVEDATRLASTEDPATGLASDPGTGKTFTSLLAATMVGAERILVFCPAVARAVWELEVADMDVWDTYRIGKDKGPLPAGKVVVIIGYEHAVSSGVAREKMYEAGHFDLIICDEAHYLKNPDAQRTQLIYFGQTFNADRVWPLSGTFMLNHPGELWPHLNFLAPDRIDRMDYFHFTRKYCRFQIKNFGGNSVETIVGANRATRDELKDRMIGLFVRRNASISNLPPLNFQMYPLDPADCDAAALRDLVGDEEDAADQLRNLLEASVRSGDLSGLKALDPHIARLRAVLAKAKAPAVAAYADTILKNTDQKIILWAWHTEALDILYKKMGKYNAVMIRGDTPQTKRDKAVKDFQNDPKCRVFIGQIQAAGTAITLTKATREIFTEQAFTPALNFQAAKRAHRIGQTQSVLEETCYLPDTIDEGVIKMLNAKLADIAALEGAI